MADTTPAPGLANPAASGSLRASAAAAATRLFETDFTRRAAFAALASCFLVLRAPFLPYGHGTDPDAWRVAMTAYHLLETGDYFPSRLPGNPLHELVTVLLIPGGWIATGIATALVSLAGVYLFARIVRHLELPQPGLLVIGFAFTPLLFINSIATMDYMWTLTCILAAYGATLRRSSLLAGLCIGLAIGFRLQSFILWPAFAYLLWRQDQRRDIAPFTLAMAGVAALAYAPVLAVYGGDFYNFYDAHVGYLDVIRLLGKEALGVLGGLGVLTGAALSLRRLRHLPADALRDPQVAVWLGIIVIYLGTFSRLPHEIAYLIPIFPFGIFLMARYFTRVALIGSIAAILFAGLADITTPGDSLNLTSLRSASVGRGLVLSNAETMEIQRQFVEDIMGNDVPDHSVVMTGFIFPQLAVRERDRLEARIVQRDYEAISMLSDRGEAVDTERDIHYVWLLTYESFNALRSQGYAFYQVPDAAGSTGHLYDYRPGLLGASFLNLDRTAPSAGKGTANTDR
ncbi:MAG: DUF2029 domain-containing protein [Dehalococcoidia bacterium]|nr:DUF2029 domain-containing protein [Dehalococcoidia bacterium]